jgi:hypothetical protein
MNCERIKSGGGNYLVQVTDNNKVLIVGDGLVTVWENVEDFYKNLDGENNAPLKSFEY